MPSDFDSNIKDLPQHTLHPVRGIVWAAAWGTPLAASIVMAINYDRSENSSAALKALLAGGIATAALLTILITVPEAILDRLPNFIFFVPQIALVYILAKVFQEDLIKTHKSEGGTVASAWPSVGIGILSGTFILGALFATDYLFAQSLGPAIHFGDDEIYYSGEATETDVQKLADVLIEEDFFGFEGGSSTRIEAKEKQYSISFVLIEEAWNDLESVAIYHDVGKAILAAGFPAPLKLKLCDEYFTVQKTILIE